MYRETFVRKRRCAITPMHTSRPEVLTASRGERVALLLRKLFSHNKQPNWRVSHIWTHKRSYPDREYRSFGTATPLRSLTTIRAYSHSHTVSRAPVVDPQISKELARRSATRCAYSVVLTGDTVYGTAGGDIVEHAAPRERSSVTARGSGNPRDTAITSPSAARGELSCRKRKKKKKRCMTDGGSAIRDLRVDG